jgi:Cft2 family RNA processing exonuclease
MEVTIHKGSHEISGNCIHVSSGKTTILLDAGLPLSTDSQPDNATRYSPAETDTCELCTHSTGPEPHHRLDFGDDN